jgi:Uma2 family endonuclease
MGQRTTDGVARPPQPDVSCEEWLARPEDARPSEWVDGEGAEFLPPKTIHQAIIVLLTQLVGLFVSPYEMKLLESSREPDPPVVANASLGRIDDNRLTGPADLAIEIVSDDSVEKRAEDEAAGVREYWILDPRPGRFAFEMLVLGNDRRYAPVASDEAGRYRSVVLPVFWLDPARFRPEPLPKLDALMMAIVTDAEPTGA